MNTIIKIEKCALDLEHYYDLAELFEHDHGAQVTFTGFVRQQDYHEPITHLYIEYFPQVTEQEIQNIVEQAQKKWQLSLAIVVHRVGEIPVGKPIVWIMTQSKHRIDAYAANEFIMDYLKVSAPFWKKEHFENGHEHWVAAKKSDQEKSRVWA